MVFGIGAYWTADRTQMLRDLWSDPKITAAMIARQLGGEVSRCAVIGKARRLHLERRARRGPPKREGEQRAQRSRSTRFRAPPELCAEPIILVIEQPDPANRKTIMELRDCHCRWPIGDLGKKDFFFCGDPTASLQRGRPYCAMHTELSRKGGYDARKDFDRSINACYEAVRERMANGGLGWEPKQ